MTSFPGTSSDALETDHSNGSFKSLMPIAPGVNIDLLNIPQRYALRPVNILRHSIDMMEVRVAKNYSPVIERHFSAIDRIAFLSRLLF